MVNSAKGACGSSDISLPVLLLFLVRTGKPSQPLIESAVRQTSYLWTTLSNEKIVVPNDHAIFTSGTVVGIDKFESASTGTDKSKTKGKVRRDC
jgi:hypothetical protein